MRAPILAIAVNTARTYNLNQNISIGNLTFGDSNSTSPNNSTIAAGVAGNIALFTNGTITALSGANTISANITLMGDTTIVNSGNLATDDLTITAESI